MTPTKILVNATTITVGGGIQAAISFIEYAMALGPSGPKFLFAVSTPVFNGLATSLRHDRRFRLFEESPAHPWKRRKIRRALLRLEDEFAPHLVYSIGFPSYVAFKTTEVGRYTNPWEICSLPAAEARLSTYEQIVRFLKSRYRLCWARHARYFETQTEVAKNGIVSNLGVDPERIFVLPNSVNPRFIEAGQNIEAMPSRRRSYRILCLSAAHRHKNLTIVPGVAAILERKFGLDCQFVLTLPSGSDLWRIIANDAERLGVRRRVGNVGPIDLDGCVRQYREATCLFLPTLAEIFSATYLEAMAMRVPIVTTDLDFARSICEDAAVYYDPLSADAAAQAIRSVVTNDALRSALVEKGSRRLRDFPDPTTKHRRLLDWLISIATAKAAVVSA